MKCVINSQVVLSQPPQGPLAGYIKPFAESLSEQGYALDSIQYQALLAACFSRWLKQKGIGLRRISAVHRTRYLRYRARHLRPRQGDCGALTNLINFLRRQGAVPEEKQTASRLTPVEQCTQAFEQYLREARALAHATIINYVPFVHGFLEGRFGQGPVTLAHLCANDVVRFVQRQVPRLHLKRAAYSGAFCRHDTIPLVGKQLLCAGRWIQHVGSGMPVTVAGNTRFEHHSWWFADRESPTRYTSPTAHHPATIIGPLEIGLTGFRDCGTAFRWCREVENDG